MGSRLSTLSNHSAALALIAAATSSLILGETPLLAQGQAATGEVRGRVGTDTGINFEGAEVTIVELDRSTVTRDGGTFAFDDIPAGEYTLRTVYLGATTVEQPITVTAGSAATNVEVVLRDAGGVSDAASTILVFGQTASASSAANRKRNSSRVSDSVSADFIGQFPDQNVTEAAQRIPGVAINRDQGEGRFILGPRRRSEPQCGDDQRRRRAIGGR